MKQAIQETIGLEVLKAQRRLLELARAPASEVDLARRRSNSTAALALAAEMLATKIKRLHARILTRFSPKFSIRRAATQGS